MGDGSHAFWTPTVVRGVVAGIAAGLIGVHLLYPIGVTGDSTYLATTIGAAVAAWLGARRRPAVSRLPFSLVALGITLSALGDVIWTVTQRVTGVAPDVSLADPPYLLSYVAIGAGLALVNRQRHGGVDFDGITDALAVGIVAFLVVWQFSLQPLIEDSSESIIAELMMASYPILDVVLLALVVRAVGGRRARTSTGVLLAVGVLCWLISDYVYTASDVADGFVRWLDAGWLIGACVLAAAAWPRHAPSPEPVAAVELDRQAGAGRVAFAVGLLIAPQIIELPIYVGGGHDANPALLILATVMLGAIVFYRALAIVRAKEHAWAELRTSQNYFQKLATNSSDAVLVADRDGLILDESPALAAMVGRYALDGDSAARIAIDSLIDIDVARATFQRSVAAPGEVIETEVRARHLNGSVRWLAARVVNLLDDPDVRGIVVNLHDISERKRAENELSHRAFHDELTGLANRALFRDRVSHALVRRVDSKAPVVIFLDLDGFKRVNDSLGHERGDELLREVGGRLVAAMRPADTVARLGGDEFAILVEPNGHAVTDATFLADRVLKALAVPMDLGEHQVTISASLGIAVADERSSPGSLLRNADIAMYRSKTNGRGQWAFFEPEMRAAAFERLQLESDLYSALDAGQLRLEYQPVVELETEDVVGFEALLRWNHPTLGLVTPDRFVPIAEDNGLIVPIGRWVLNEACQAVARWQQEFDRPDLTMAINLSMRQLADPDLVVDVAEAFAHAGLDPRRLVLETTESMLVRDPSSAADRLHALRRLGVQLAVDDFGTGYSSLSYLRQFPVDILKIDRSFIHAITDRNEVPALVRALLDLGRTLELETVAEGIELPEQRDLLRDQNCTFGQGYLFSMPLSAEAAEDLLRCPSSPRARMANAVEARHAVAEHH